MGASRQRPGVTADDRRLGRRACLRALGATAAAGALAGCGGLSDESNEPATETTERTATDDGRPADPDESTSATTEEADRFETVVNVADAGVDTGGEERVDGLLGDLAADDTMLYFPPGRYRFGKWNLNDYRNLGIVGDDATFVPPAGKQDYWLAWGGLEDLLFEGFTLDCTADGVAPVNHISVTGGRSAVRDVSLLGHRRVPRSGFEIAAADPDAELLFENVRLPDGSTAGNAIYAFPKSVGSLIVRNCRVEDWAEGLYASPHSGPLEVVGGYYANNGIDQVRVGGGPSGAVVRDVTVRVDDPERADSKPNMRGIWMEEGGSVRIENCDIAITDLTGTYSSGAIVVGQQFGAATIEDTTIRTDAEAPAISIRNPIDSIEGQTMPSMDRLPEDWRVTCRNVTVTGSVGSGTAIRAVERDDCTFENVCLSHPEGSRDGVRIESAEGCAVRNATIAVGGDAVVAEDASVETSGVRTEGSCDD